MSDPIVLHVLEALQAGGGTGRHVLDIVRHAHGVRHEVVVPRRRHGWPPDPDRLAALEAAGATLHLVAMRRAPAHPGNALALRRLRAIVRARRPAVVHGHSAIGGVLGRLAAPDDVARVYTPNGITNLRPGLMVERALGRRRTDVLVAVSPGEAAMARDLGLVAADRIETIPNGIEPDAEPTEVDLRSLLGVPAGTPLVGSVARLVHQKAPEDFVAVAARVPDVHFVLIGAGPRQRAVERAVREAGLGARWHHVELLPHVDRVLGQLDVFVLTSRFEGGPYTPLEAMRAGTPVVVTDVVGNRDAAADGRVGLLAPAGDVDGLAAAVSRLLADDARRARLGAAGREHVRAHHDVAEQGRAHAALYARLADTASR